MADFMQEMQLDGEEEKQIDIDNQTKNRRKKVELEKVNLSTGTYLNMLK